MIRNLIIISLAQIELIIIFIIMLPWEVRVILRDGNFNINVTNLMVIIKQQLICLLGTLERTFIVCVCIVVASKAIKRMALIETVAIVQFAVSHHEVVTVILGVCVIDINRVRVDIHHWHIVLPRRVIKEGVHLIHH